MTSEQKKICEKYGAVPMEASEELTAGVAENVWGDLIPVNGLRHPPGRGTTGWFIWAGEELSSAPDFFAPVHVKHLHERPEVLRYLALPPGWRFLIAGSYEDVWFDASLLDI